MVCVDEDGEDEDGVLGSSFGGRSTVEVFDLPENETMFLPTNMDAAQLSFKFKEVVYHLGGGPPREISSLRLPLKMHICSWEGITHVS